MNYRTVSVSRRVVMGKVKSKPSRITEKPPLSRRDNVAKGAEMATVPLLFERSSASSRLISPKPSRLNWKKITPIVGFFIALLLVVVYLARNSTDGERRVVREVGKVTSSVPEVNLRPMTGSSVPRQAAGGGGKMMSGMSGGGALSQINSQSLTVHRSSPIGYLATHDEIDLAMIDGSAQILLPSDVSGNCNVGDRGVKDLSSCLVKVGAHVK